MTPTLQSILLKAKEDVYTYLSGGNLSRILGQGYDFSELRPYEQGDDIRHISWINSAKLGQPYVKKMQEERELNIAVCSILDGRFIIGKKRETLLQTLAVLGYSTYVANDIFTLITVFESGIKIYEPTKNFEQMYRGFEDIDDAVLLETQVQYAQVDKIYLPNKTLLFVLGDFLEWVDLSVLAQKHEVIVIMIRDVSEVLPQPAMTKQLMSPYTDQPLSQTLSHKAVQHYQAKLLEHDGKLLQHFRDHHIRYIQITTPGEIVVKLRQLFFI